jgi:hypothetical protein
MLAETGHASAVRDEKIFKPNGWRVLQAAPQSAQCGHPSVRSPPNLISHGGLVLLAALAERAGLHESAAANVRLGGDHGANAGLKTACLAAGMAAGADSIDDMDPLRHGAMERAFGGVRAPSTPGSFLRSFTWGNVSQLQKTHREALAGLAELAPLLPGAGTLAFIDVDSTQKRVIIRRIQA